MLTTTCGYRAFVRHSQPTVQTSIIMNRTISRASLRANTHYDVLGVSRTATPAQIREAFISLSKRVHPDKNMGDSSTHAKFIEINEAYTVLSDQSSRRLYDLGLYSGSTADRPSDNYSSATTQGPFYYHRHSGVNDFGGNSDKFHDASFWENRKKSEDKFYRNKSYYGIKGLPRLPNFVIVIGICIFILGGVVAHYIAIQMTTRYRIKRMDELHEVYSKTLGDVQQQAKLHSKELQLERVAARVTEQAKQYRKARGSSND
ncbi:PREDICTED: dnaJ homolog subfamily C member 4-like [Priapulus caudatus]|uniref:DnaJ homolog subfamily C member 4-like n=1 Tax=Priapulus caudatus TaxID=37621 RepID=A0ABM1E171_PRICU|nr:PREDICTED: dnaJ homolog subfamily C member 4-like [Priapulus caudatus]